MSSELYNILSKTIDRLNKNSNTLDSCMNDVVELRNRVSPKIYGIHIKSSCDSVTLSMKCTDDVRCLTAYDYITVPGSEDTQTVTIENVNGDIFFDNAHNILELDISNQQITSIEISEAYSLSKLVVYNNNLTTLDLSNCPKLQFLHMHNNPICNEDRYKNNLYTCMNSLTDRFMCSTGSVILYPWYGLEILICKDANQQYIKYPVGYSKLAFEEGRLYGVVENNIISYYTYSNSELVEHSAMNRHHSLRKELENEICLKKNWVFGSAIMYSDDWDSCSWDFRQNNIADMWETAEKGFGLTWGSSDAYTNTLPGFEYFNIKDFRYFGNAGTTLETLPKALDYTSDKDWGDYTANTGNPYYKYKTGGRTHGDSILSIVLGTQWSNKKIDRRFGYIPNACASLNDNMCVDSVGNKVALLNFDSFPLTMQHLANSSDAMSFSFGISSEHPNILISKNILGKFGESNPVLVSAGNNGDGKQYTQETLFGATTYVGNYSDVDEHGNTVDRQVSAMFIGSCGPTGQVSPFSSSSINANELGTNRDTYLSAYGDQVFVWTNYLESLKCGAGTSYATPMCCSILMLLMNVYKKMFPEETSFGSHSNFMRHVRNRWCVHNSNNMDMGEGYGMPNILAEPYSYNLINNNTDSTWEPKITYTNTVPAGTNINLEYDAVNDRVKRDCTVEPQLSYIAINGSNDVYPLKPASNIKIKVYSNSSLSSPESYDTNYYMKELVISAVATNALEVPNAIELCETVITTDFCNESVIKSSQDYLDCEKFTVQFALDFSDKLYPADIGQYTTSRDLFYFYNGDELGRFYISGINYTSGDKYITLSNKTMLHHRYFSDVKQRSRNLIETQSVGYGINNKVDFDATPYAIVTVTVSEDLITYYINGTNVGSILKSADDNIQLSKLYVNKNSLCHNGIECVRMYDRILDEKEIIQNTVWMLNSHFNEVV